VSCVLEWNGYKFVFGGDSFRNRWFVEHETNSDLVMHECFLTPDLMVKYSGQSPMEKEKNNEYT